MTNDSIRAVLSALLVVLSIIGLLLGGGAAAAQPAENSSEADDPDPKEIQQQLGDLNIHSAEWTEQKEGQWTVEIRVTWTGETPTTMRTTEMLDPNSGSQSIGIDSTRLLPGEETVISVSLSGESGVIVSTPESVREQEAAALTPDKSRTGRDVPLLGGVLLGVTIGGAGTAYAGYRRLRTTSAVEKVSEQ